MIYRLSIHKIDQSCLFDLTWGKGQRLTASLAFPAALLVLYDAWRRAYLGYYKQALRGRVGTAGQVVSVAIDWHSQLVQAEARLLSEFHTWLKHGDLFDLRAELLTAVPGAGPESVSNAKTELFLTCSPIEMARLPWETWEVGQHMQIVRSPAHIRAASADRRSFRRGKARVLAILGDETGLNFTGERTALNAQKQLLDIHYIGWQPGEEVVALKQRICQTIADPLGWDVLFFAGHSNEAALVDGQVAIAPHTAISVKELSPYLQQAQQHGLQFALFNSCSGLDIAHGLINLGLSQVAIMREPIHNEVAQTFLVQLLQRLARYENAQEALAGACRFLKVEQNLTYPSAYLVPSLFRHPDSVPYQVQPVGWQSIGRQWRPNRWEALSVTAIALLSLISPVHYGLLNRRVLAQAIYRDLTRQVPAMVEPPVVLVQVDSATFSRWGATDFKPIDRGLLADILTRLTEQQATVIGVDYLLDLPQPENDAALSQAIRQAVAQNQAWQVFITKQNAGGDWSHLYDQVAPSDLILQGDAWVPYWQLPIQPPPTDYGMPFSYQLALAHRLNQQARSGKPAVPQPGVVDLPLETQVQTFLRHNVADLPYQAGPTPLTRVSSWLGQRWLQPLIDFSIPPDRVYQAVPAWQLLESPPTALGTSALQERVVIVAPGGYDAAGIASDGDDNLPLPPAMGYWRRGTTHITGGEAHAYMTHHLLTHRLVIPIPDLGMILLAALVGKGLTLYLANRPRVNPLRLGAVLAAVTAGSGLASLQLYISAAVLLPWLLPSLTVWLYALPMLKEKAREQR
ncbi:CHASE2 domain-containing protein [Nodosilinea sp. LEGE 07088]|uniref:CHASE2 domain-containing protein n=1 Tax=Nodosilinea sp. LEGE 07088 TaxID=2777968 RepID=UPI00187FC6EA|nr:CHASE2 domain-containing protein [Nodosilinea sp. LEGE 07088]MBE9140200.1 CHASE2 domain-containing protein [Nodosilinea sp. LEGE 07088]